MWIAASVAGASAFNPNGIKTLLANDLRTFPIKGNLVFSNGLKLLPKNLPDCPILCNWVFDNFIFADELFEEVLGSLEIYVLVTNNLCAKLLSPLESSTLFDGIFKVTSVPFFIPEFKLLSCELLSIDIVLKQKNCETHLQYFHNSLWKI